LLTLFATFAFAFLLSRLLLQNPDYGYWLQLVYLNIVYGQAEEVDRENRPEEQQQVKRAYLIINTIFIIS